MDEERAADGVEHLQTAARELLLAARSFLDVVEEVVDDRERLAGAASSVVGMVRDGLATVASPAAEPQPWEQPAWGGADPGAPAADASNGDESSAGAPRASADDRPAPEVADEAPTRRRVRRIAVD